MLRFAIILAAVAVSQVHSERIYRLYTRTNERVAVNMTSNMDKLPAELNLEENTIILIHGQGGSPGSRFDQLIRDDIFNFKKEHNVIVVDWRKEANEAYSVAIRYVETVANELAVFLRRLATPEARSKPNDPKTVVEMDTVHLVGFGLGAHIAGIASRKLRDPLGVVARITGLDPSGKQWGSNSERLRDTDADYVEVIHTDGSGLLANGIGTNIGHVNFHANGGSNQPGCFSHSCSHDRAYELFAASMRGNHLVGRACSSTTQLNLNLCRGTQMVMGGTDLSKSKYNRIYRVNTGRTYPF